MPRAKKRGASKNTVRLYDEVWKLAEILGRGDKTAGLDRLVLHAKESISQEVCPICKKPFDECDYFRNLEDE